MQVLEGKMFQVERVLFKNSIKDIVAFRFDAFSKLVGIPIQLGLMYFLWNYVVAQVNSSFNITYVMGYYSLMLVLSLQYPFVRLSNDIESKVMKGGYFRNLVSGISLTKEYFIDYIARTFWFNSIAIPVSLLIYHSFTATDFELIEALIFTLHILIGSIILFFLWMIVGLSAFVLVMNRGLAALIFNLQRLCIGSIVPLTMLPDVVFLLIKFTPFPYAFYFATEQYMGTTNVGLSLFAYQLLWCAGLASLACLLEAKTITKIEMGAV
jgi:ABC-type uncharacterized transport system permease subunit